MKTPCPLPDGSWGPSFLQGGIAQGHSHWRAVERQGGVSCMPPGPSPYEAMLAKQLSCLVLEVLAPTSCSDTMEGQ